MMAQEAAIGYELYLPSSSEFAKITQIVSLQIPSRDLVAVYTFSNTLIANDVFASCQSDGDYSEYLDLLERLVGEKAAPTIAQKAGQLIESFLSLRRG